MQLQKQMAQCTWYALMRVWTAKWSSTTFWAIAGVWDIALPCSREEGRLASSPGDAEAWALRKYASQDWQKGRIKNNKNEAHLDYSQA